MLKENKETGVSNTGLFGKQNYIIMIVGVVVIAIGFLLMMGGKSTDPNNFDPKEVYSTTRITIAPFLIILGFVIEIVGILKKPNQI